MITLIMHLMVWKDITYAAPPSRFRDLKILGIIYSLLGFGVFLGYLIQGILVHESGKCHRF